MIDAFDVVGSPSLSKFDDLDERIGWSRDWAKVTDATMYGGTYRTVTKSGASVDIAFTGTSIAWVSPTSTNYGKADVYLDGAKVATVDLYSTSYAKSRTVWESAQLPDTSHRLRIVALGDKRSAATDTRIALDSVAVSGSVTRLVFDQADPMIGWESGWLLQSDTNIVGGSYRHTTTSGSVANIGFTGTSVEWIAPVAPNYGLADVYLDGTLVATVDQYASAYRNKQTVWSSGRSRTGRTTSASCREERSAWSLRAPVWSWTPSRSPAYRPWRYDEMEPRT